MGPVQCRHIMLDFCDAKAEFSRYPFYVQAFARWEMRFEP